MRDSFATHSVLCGSGSASAPEFFTISRCVTNGHFAFDCSCAVSVLRSANCAPIISAGGRIPLHPRAASAKSPRA